jgi:sterol 14alpha-demethylase
MMVHRAVNPPHNEADRDLLGVVIAIEDEGGQPRFTADESLTWASCSCSLAVTRIPGCRRHSDIYRQLVTELDELDADDQEVSRRRSPDDVAFRTG